MTQPRLVHPEYAERFLCIGSACEDTCCKGWGIPVDREAYEKYRKLPPSPLRTLIQISCLITPKDTVCVDGSGQIVPEPEVFAKIRMTPDNQCPMLQGDGLCRIQTEYGAEFLSKTCASYPRIVHSIGGIEEKALALSCPEAARLVLLDPWLFAPIQPVPTTWPTPPDAPYHPHPEDNPAGGDGSLLSWFWSIRECVLALVQNRSYELWQRLFLLGIFCRRLDGIAEGDFRIAVPAFLCEFEASIASGRLRTAMEAMEIFPTDDALQLDMVLKLAGMLLKNSNTLPRFSECVRAFTAGIGYGPGATLQSLAAQYALSHNRFYAPFFDRHPHILENYLINTMVRCQFPLREGRAGARPSMAHEYALLTAQFALMKGLLIGVAGRHREAFCAEHVVHTVQAASRHFEHHPHFLAQARALLVENKMEGARGLAVLLRNTELAATKAAPAAYAATG